MTRNAYEGPALDATYQHITERPALEDEADEVEYATPASPDGEERTEGVPVPEPDEGEDEGEDEDRDDQAPIEIQRPDVAGQSTWADWSGGDRS